MRQNCALHGFYLQNTSFTTLGMFLEGFLVSPAVIPRLSVPPTAAMHIVRVSRRKQRYHPQAKLAVTKTLANPPNPPTNGAPAIFQLVRPINLCSVLTPTLTRVPTIMKATTVTTLSEDNQYSAISRIINRQNN